MIINRPFSPPIGKYKIPNNLISNLNTYVDEVINDRKKTKDLDYGDNLVGEVVKNLSFQKKLLIMVCLLFLDTL